MNWLEYDMPLWRPPSEARSLILQATIGCSFNRCSFCSMYREKEYRARPLDELFEEIDATSQAMPHVRRVFLADGDAFVLDTDHLMRILERLQKAFPDLQRVSSYAWPLQILKKTPEELALLKRNKLSLIYVGVESGVRPEQDIQAFLVGKPAEIADGDAAGGGLRDVGPCRPVDRVADHASF